MLLKRKIEPTRRAIPMKIPAMYASTIGLEKWDIILAFHNTISMTVTYRMLLSYSVLYA